ncbi:hypothetical protein E2C01_038076 [Portunus trituberculatus]|uniref:Uncharacterized protein n=1 Tax=Portunus trituberculatus TaxID=210409 RepID=A0A5B7FH13_PORTR|nr:hypothetical protein [Portunus trituberculatus]
MDDDDVERAYIRKAQCYVTAQELSPLHGPPSGVTHLSICVSVPREGITKGSCPQACSWWLAWRPRALFWIAMVR